jgi:hypothetical protein
MEDYLESSSSPEPASGSPAPGGWLKMGAIAAGSLLAGGLLAAWWYRNTLQKLQQAEENGQNPHFGIRDDDPADET